MKRIVTLAIVGALILGLIIPTVIFAQENPSQGQPPQLNPHEQTVLLVIAEDQALAAGAVFESEWIDASPYRVFKLYARQTQASGEAPVTKVRIRESALGATTEDVYELMKPEWGGPDAEEQNWTIAYEFSGLFSKIMVRVKNTSGDASANVHLYLLMSEE